MDGIDIAAAIENGRPRAASKDSKERSRYSRFTTLKELWEEYTFQIVVVIISFILLIYTIAGKLNHISKRKHDHNKTIATELPLREYIP